MPVRRRILAAYLVSGCLAGLAGVLWLARFGTVVADAANGWELQVVSAVVVGGVAIIGGVGSVYGAALGALLLTTIGSALVVLRVNPFWQQAITGALLLLAISVDRVLALRVARAAQKEKPPWLSTVLPLGRRHASACCWSRSFAGGSSQPRLAASPPIGNLSFALGDLGEIALIALP